MKQLVVNGDDLGLSPGVNTGIIEAHERGILTSASLIVNMRWSGDAARRVESVPGLSVGLHVNVDDGELEPLRDQLARFRDMIGRSPAHIDSHHNDHERPELLGSFTRLASELDVPLRGHSSIRSVTSFYGRWDDVSHPEQIGIDGLASILRTRVADGVTELACHPGYVDGELRSSYRDERAIELATLCDPRVPAILRELEITLVGSSEAMRAVHRTDAVLP